MLMVGNNWQTRLYIILFLVLVALTSVSAQYYGYTHITDNSSVFGGNVSAEGFYEWDGTYVIPLSKVDWSLGTGQFTGMGYNITLNLSSLTNALNLDWNNITGKPIYISYWENDVGYITLANVSNNLSDYNNDMFFVTASDLTWNNISGKPTDISYWLNDVGYITIGNLSYLEQGIASLNATKSGIGNCPAGYVVQNLTTGSPQCVQMIMSETDPIFVAENQTIWYAIWSKLDITDQRYNDTALIYQISGDLYTNIDNINLTLISLQSQIDALNLSKLDIIDQRYNDTAWVIQYISSLNITNGTDGINGTNGINGIDGQNGTNGVDGINGTNGVNGTSVTLNNVIDNFDGTFTWQFSDGYNFTTGNLTGNQGVAGTNGTNGIDGLNGTNGIDGLNGTNGIDGLNGTDGIDGIDGINGTNGVDGLNGTNGINGIDGLNGTNGINGIDGLNGTSVFMSSITNNLDGTYTWYFSDGYNFTTGNLTGAQGIQGIQGIAGINGTNGIDGLNGTNGVDGLNGTNGIDGQNGTSVIFVNIIDNLDGTYIWQFSDGYNFTTGNLTGKQGVQGIQGVAGLNGTNGVDGVNGTNGIDGLNGTNGIDGINGTNGIDGINGTNGIDGINGTNGINGLNGTNGINGIDGINGTNGVDGLNGSDGIDGLNGTDGINGTNGINGLNGTNGVDGLNGTNGVDGVNGTNGTSFFVGDGYLYNNGSNVIFFNETKLNRIFEENVTFSVSGGVGTGTTTRCCSANSEILEVAVFPLTITNNYKFSANSTITGQVVDTNRATHVGNWIVQHNGVVVPAGEKIQYYVTNANINENFRVRVRWEQ